MRHLVGRKLFYVDLDHVVNGWDALGMVRTLATIQASEHADELQSEQTDLINWVDEILNGSWAWQKANGTLYNTIDGDDFADTSGTAAIAAASRTRRAAA